jgi:hypothetical protein
LLGFCTFVYLTVDFSSPFAGWAFGFETCLAGLDGDDQAASSIERTVLFAGAFFGF